MHANTPASFHKQFYHREWREIGIWNFNCKMFSVTEINTEILFNFSAGICPTHTRRDQHTARLLGNRSWCCLSADDQREFCWMCLCVQCEEKSPGPFTPHWRAQSSGETQNKQRVRWAPVLGRSHWQQGWKYGPSRHVWVFLWFMLNSNMHMFNTKPRGVNINT